MPDKGQLKSERIYEIINFPKNDPKNFKDFCPESFTVHRVEILQILKS